MTESWGDSAKINSYEVSDYSLLVPGFKWLLLSFL